MKVMLGRIAAPSTAAAPVDHASLGRFLEEAQVPDARAHTIGRRPLLGVASQ